MKKYIIGNILLIFVLAVLIAFSISRFELAQNHYEYYKSLTNAQEIELYKELYINAVIYGILFLVAAFADLIAIILFSLKGTTGFQAIYDKLLARKSARNAAKAEQAEAKKQDKIKALEAELEELKKDE